MLPSYLTRNKGKEKSSHEEVAWEVKTAPGRTDQVLGVEGAGCAGRLALTGWLSSCGLSKWRMVLLWSAIGALREESWGCLAIRSSDSVLV